MKKCHTLRLDGREYRLRLTMAGQKRLRNQFDKQPSELIWAAIDDVDVLCAVLETALSWPESGNPITDGEAFYDLLVDEGYAGQERYGPLLLDIAAASGILSRETARKAKQMVSGALDRAFDQLGQQAEANPTPGLMA